MIFDGLGVFLGKFELHFIGEEKFNEEIHYLTIFFILEELIQKHFHTASHK